MRITLHFHDFTAACAYPRLGLFWNCAAALLARYRRIDFDPSPRAYRMSPSIPFAGKTCVR